MGRTGTPDQRAARVAARQHGAIRRQQALDAGLSDDQIQWRLATQRWLSPEQGVYTFAGSHKSPERPAAVACLAAPEGTVASHASAAALLGLLPHPAVPHVTAPRSSSGRLHRAVVHRPRRPVDSVDVCRVSGLPCTTPARTLVDCAAVLPYSAFCKVVDAALCRGLTTPGAVRAAAARAGGRGRKGVANLKRALEAWDAGPAPESPPEMELYRRLVEWGFPTPRRQYRIIDSHGVEVARADIAIPDWKAVLEYDGAEVHGPRQAPADALRQRRIEAAGWHVERISKGDLRPPATALRRRLAQRFRRAAA